MVPIWRPQQWLLGDTPNFKLLPATFHCQYLKSIKSLFFHPDSQIPRRCSIIITCGSISTMSGLFNVSIFFNSIIHQPICQLEIAGDVACTSAMKTVMVWHLSDITWLGPEESPLPVLLERKYRRLFRRLALLWFSQFYHKLLFSEMSLSISYVSKYSQSVRSEKWTEYSLIIGTGWPHQFC